MDILAHGLYGGALAKIIKLKTHQKVSYWQSFFWGLFPDLFAFSISFVWIFFEIISGERNFGDFPNPEHSEPLTSSGSISPVFGLSAMLYNYSHSLIIFAIVFGAVSLIRRKPQWAMLGWVLHILADIPTHTYKFYPTPVFWPLSDVKFSGFSWGTPWFIVANYTVIILLYWFLRKKDV